MKLEVVNNSCKAVVVDRLNNVVLQPYGTLFVTPVLCDEITRKFSQISVVDNTARVQPSTTKQHGGHKPSLHTEDIEEIGDLDGV